MLAIVFSVIDGYAYKKNCGWRGELYEVQVDQYKKRELHAIMNGSVEVWNTIKNNVWVLDTSLSVHDAFF